MCCWVGAALQVRVIHVCQVTLTAAVHAPILGTYVLRMGALVTGPNAGVRDRIADALFGRTKRNVLVTLFTRPEASLHLREIVRLSGVGTGSVQRELARLVGAGLITRERRGSQVHFSPNTASPVFGEVYSLLAKTIGIAGVLRKAFQKLEPHALDVAFVYGSVARGEHRGDSDVDVIVVGTAGLRQLQPMLREAEADLGREVNASIYTRDELAGKLRAGDPFLHRALDGPRIMLIGVDGDVERMARESMAATA